MNGGRLPSRLIMDTTLPTGIYSRGQAFGVRDDTRLWPSATYLRCEIVSTLNHSSWETHSPVLLVLTGLGWRRGFYQPVTEPFSMGDPLPDPSGPHRIGLASWHQTHITGTNSSTNLSFTNVVVK